MSVIAPPAVEPHSDLGVRSEPSVLRPLLVIASLGAAAIHFGFAPAHLQTNTVHGAFFLAVAWMQVAWAIAVARNPSRLTYRFGIVLNLGVIAVWLVSRTVGISGEVEPFGFPDTVAAGLEAFIVLGSFGPLTRRLPSSPMSELTTGVMLGASAFAVTALVSASMVPSLSGHGDGAGADHHGASATEPVTAAASSADHHASGGGAAAATSSDVAGAGDHAAQKAVPYDPEMPINLGGVQGVTPKQQAEAENIVATTLSVLPKWEDPEVAEAAGFRSIGDGSTGTEHLMNQENMDDDIILDPNKPESLVYDIKDGRRELAAAMYMTKPGVPLDEVPTLGGSLVQWHVHQNLCYNDQGKVAGITNAEGKCRPGLVKPEETPMIHVWIRPHPCGPFAALEGIGAGAIKEGEERLCDSAHGGS